ncbi:MAG: tetraacyldisaccharide 4'-kinase [Acidobacteria bacterium]|nr:tetraacyldisaccharide 4'-kinase [Acidobacteriota bacterium]
MNVLSATYGRATEWRRAWYGRPDRVRRLDRPVISVGNLVLGGSGKTPLVAALARLLSAAGERPSILSRGYGRQRAADGVLVVSDGEQVLAEAAQAGDEPCMLARALAGVPVFVSPDRYLSGRLAERRFGSTVHLLDDGFQHVRLARDIDLLAVRASDLGERLLPFGRLREPLSAARAADALLVAGSDEDAGALARALGVETVFRVAARYHPLRAISPAASSAGMPGRALAVAGIARPEPFLTALRERGVDVAGEMVFRDHHWFTARDVEAIERAAAAAGADVVITTEKDAARLPASVGRDLMSPRIPWAVLPLELTIEPPEVFAAWLAGRLAAARRRRVAA